MITAHGVPVSDVATVWPEVREHVEAPLSIGHNPLSVAGLLSGLFEDRYLLLVLRDGEDYIGAAILEHCGDSCIVVTCGGSRMKEAHRPLLDLIESIAKEYRLSEIEIRGRKGWERVLRNDGYTAKYTAVSKRICA